MSHSKSTRLHVAFFLHERKLHVRHEMQPFLYVFGFIN